MSESFLIQERGTKQVDPGLRENGSRRKGGNEDVEKVKNIDANGKTSMHGLRSHGGSESLQGR